MTFVVQEVIPHCPSNALTQAGTLNSAVPARTGIMQLKFANQLIWMITPVLAHILPTSNIPKEPCRSRSGTCTKIIKPKIFIVAMFDPEGDVWHNIPDFNVLAQNITVPGFSPLFPEAHCTEDGAICQLVTGQAEINSASTTSALVHSGIFNLTSTYFLISGIAGVSPKVATINSVTFARYAVQVALQYEIDAREKPADFPTGYIPQGSFAPNQYPMTLYGTEVFEVNDALRQRVVSLAKTAVLNDTEAAQVYRANYANNVAFVPGASPPSIVECDTATSDVFWSGNLLGDAFENVTTLLTNKTGVYCTTQQEDNGTLEALMRGSISGLVDFSRIIIMRSASDFDRPSNDQSVTDNLFGDPGSFDSSVLNLRLVGLKVIEGIMNGWEEIYRNGVKPNNYIGDIFGSLGGTPDFGPGNIFHGHAVNLRRSRK